MDKKYKILFVEDEASLRELFVTYFQNDYITVLVAENGVEGLPLIESEKPSIVFLDYNLSIMSGIEICDKIANSPEKYGKPKILLITGSLFNQDKDLKKWEEIYQLTGIIEKPFDFDELKVKIKKLLVD